MSMKRAIYIAILAGLLIPFLGIKLIGVDNAPCLSMGIIIVGLLFIFFAPGSLGATFSSAPGKGISRSVVNLESRTRQTRPSLEEEKAGLLILITGVIATVVSILLSYML